MLPSITILESLIAAYSLDAVLSAITEICDLNAERAAVNDCNVILAKCWASAQSHINEAQTLLAPLNL